MGLWHKEIVKLDGSIKVYVKIQNEFTGHIREGIREIFHKNGIDYFRADGRVYNVTEDIKAYKAYEENIKNALKFYNETNYLRR